MFLSLDELDTGDIDCDICVVGAGPAGISLAQAFDGSNRKVVLLESGDIHFDLATQDLYRGEVTNGNPSLPLNASRMRFLGGTSNHWGGSLGPYDASDFSQKPWMPLSGWPISYQQMGSYYEKAHQLLGAGPTRYLPSQWPEELDLLPLEGFDLEHRLRMRRLGGAPRFGQEFKQKFIDSDNVNLICNANLVAIERSVDGARVVALQVRSLSGKQLTVRAGNTIIACGGVENARILLHNQFDRELDFIGRCFMYHPRPVTGEIVLPSMSWEDSGNAYADWSPVNGQLMRFTFNLSEQLRREEQLSNYTFRLGRPSQQRYPISAIRLYQRLLGRHELEGVTEDLYSIFGDLDQIASKLKNSLFATAEDKQSYSLVTYIEEWPNPQSRVTLGSEVDALGVARPLVNWRLYDQEITNVYRAHELLAAELGKSGLGRVKIQEGIAEREVLEDAIRKAGGGGHQIGTTRMSRNKLEGVVDSNLKVHGVDNLYCAGSSVFPTASWVNPTLTLIALSLRLADHLKA